VFNQRKNRINYYAAGRKPDKQALPLFFIYTQIRKTRKNVLVLASPRHKPQILAVGSTLANQAKKSYIYPGLARNHPILYPVGYGQDRKAQNPNPWKLRSC
jgi:hypothetical protein